MLKSHSLEVVIGEYECSLKTLNQNGGISYEKEEVTLKETEGVVPFLEVFLFRFLINVCSMGTEDKPNLLAKFPKNENSVFEQV